MTPDDQPLNPIDRHLRHDNRLVNEDLIAELTDHYVVGISERMAQGLSFDASLRDIYANFGGRKGLREMERQYNRVTFRQYDKRWLECVREQLRWPNILMPFLITGILFWLQFFRQSSWPEPVFIASAWTSCQINVVGSLCVLLFRVFQQLYVHRSSFPRCPVQVQYILTRLLPINILLYMLPYGLTYMSSYLLFIWLYILLTLCFFILLIQLSGFEQFYKLVLEPNRRTAG